mgnify:CR=1 FL=1
MKLTEHIHGLEIPFELTTPDGGQVPRAVWVYLLFGERVWLIDCGVSSSEARIFDYLRQQGRRPEDIAQIVLTHSHPDHMGAAQAIRTTTGCSVAAHGAERAWIEHVDLQSRERPVPGFHSLVADSVAVDRILRGGQVLEAGEDLHLEVIHTPGHSKGSISLLLREEGALFCGDAVPFPGTTPVYEDIRASAASLRNLMGIKAIQRLLPSWGAPREGAEALLALSEALDYLQRIHETVLRIADGAPSLAPTELCQRAAADLGLPPAAVHPLAAQAFASSLRARGTRDLLGS